MGGRSPGSAIECAALSTFCSFAAIGITADFLLQISFFAGWMALDAYREVKHKPDCCPCCVCCAAGVGVRGLCELQRNVYMYVRMYVCMYLCMHVCMHACMYACM